MENTLSKLETMILLALDANMQHEENPLKYNPKKGKEIENVSIDAGSLLNFNEMIPTSFFTMEIGPGENNRIFTTDHNLLLYHPCEIFGEINEIALLSLDTLKWCGLRKLKKAPKNVYALGKPTHWYEYHYREVHSSGIQKYFKRVVPFSKEGDVIPARVKNLWVCEPYDGRNITLLASIIEDSLRPETMLASVVDATEIKFPVPLDAYKELFAIRDSPLAPSGKRKSILHWVSSHLRKSSQETVTTVKEHMRGVDRFVIDGITITLKPNKRN